MLRFGRVGIDLASRSITLDDEPQHLEPQAFDLLALLVVERHRVVSKEELLDTVWGDQFVSESALTTRIKEVRIATGDDGTRQAVVKTHRGRGYRFIAEESPLVVAGSSSNATPDGPDRRLFGREDDIGELESLLRPGAVVTLLGPGGVGKTTLANAMERRLGTSLARGSRVVHLAKVTENDDVVHALRMQTDVDHDAHSDTELFAALRGLDGLLVIDNCEHVIGAVAEVVEAIRERPGPLRILTTSRERLGVRLEQTWPVRPLTPELGRELLLERALELQPGFAIDGDAEADVQRLLDMVDHLPLGIEMVAARLATFGASELVGHLTDRLDLLRAPRRSITERQQNLTALTEWSLRLLEPEARTVVADLSVFRGPAHLDDLAAVLDTSASDLALGPLADLVAQSLVVAHRAESATQYGLLETVRFVVSRDRSAAVDERHARRIATVLEEADTALRGVDEAAGAKRIDDLVPDIRAAMRWSERHDLDLAGSLAASLLSYVHERQWTEPALWCDALLERLGDDTPLAVQALVAADASNRGDYELADRLASLARASSDHRVMVSATDTLANLGLYKGDGDMCRSLGSELMELGRTHGDGLTWTLGHSQHVLSNIYEGRADAARRAIDELLPPTELGPTARAWAFYGEAELLSLEGNLGDAIQTFSEAIALGRTVNSRFVVSVAEVSRLAALARGGDIAEAATTFVPVLRRHRDLNHDTHATIALRNVVALLARAGRDDVAMRILGALESHSAASTYGIESELTTAARASVEARTDAATIDRWLTDGQGQPVRWALDQAIEALSTD